jgi:phage recombination protein Bet
MNAIVSTPRAGLVAKIAGKYSVDPAKLLDTLKITCFRTDKPISNEAMMSLLIVADQYSLNPFTRELFAFEDKRTGGIVPVVSVDGWSRILNDHPQFDGLKFDFAPTRLGEAHDSIPEWCDCTIYRKDRDHPITVREYFVEVNRKTPPWQSHPRRMLRHKALIQCARVALGFSGIYDQDEAERIVEASVLESVPAGSRTEQAKTLLAKQAAAPAAEEAPPFVDPDTGELFEAPKGQTSDSDDLENR